MANKIGIFNGIILFFLNFFAVIPLGIYFSSGLSSFTGIPLYFVQYNHMTIYTWGMINSSNPLIPITTWWIGLGRIGLLNFLLIQIFMFAAFILTFLGSFTKSNAGRKGLIISLILMILVIVFIIIDVLALGIYLIGTVIPIGEIFNFLGMGVYLIIAVIILQFFAIKVQSNSISES